MTAAPCPFCGSGSDAIVVCEGSTFRWRVAVCDGCGSTGPEVRVQTAGEGAPAEWEAKAVEAALAAWNTRA